MAAQISYRSADVLRCYFGQRDVSDLYKQAVAVFLDNFDAVVKHWIFDVDGSKKKLSILVKSTPTSFVGLIYDDIAALIALEEYKTKLYKNTPFEMAPLLGNVISLMKFPRYWEFADLGKAKVDDSIKLPITKESIIQKYNALGFDDDYIHVIWLLSNSVGELTLPTDIKRLKQITFSSIPKRKEVNISRGSPLTVAYSVWFNHAYSLFVRGQLESVMSAYSWFFDSLMKIVCHYGATNHKYGLSFSLIGYFLFLSKTISLYDKGYDSREYVLRSVCESNRGNLRRYFSIKIPPHVDYFCFVTLTASDLKFINDIKGPVHLLNAGESAFESVQILEWASVKCLAVDLIRSLRISNYPILNGLSEIVTLIIILMYYANQGTGYPRSDPRIDLYKVQINGTKYCVNFVSTDKLFRQYSDLMKRNVIRGFCSWFGDFVYSFSKKHSIVHPNKWVYFTLPKNKQYLAFDFFKKLRLIEDEDRYIYNSLRKAIDFTEKEKFSMRPPRRGTKLKFYRF